MDVIILIAGVVLLIVGIIKRKESWGKPVLIIGVIMIAVSLYFAWPDFVEGYEAGRGATGPGDGP